MSRPCVVCHHPQQQAINAELVSGTPRLSVARRFGLSEPAVRRHFHVHLPESLRIAAEVDRQQASRELWQILRATTSELMKVAVRARDLRQRRAYVRALRILYPLLELRARTLEHPAAR
jgi:hypothetical protein